MTISTVDDIAAGLAASTQIPFMKVFGTPKTGGAFQSGWLASPSAGVASPAYTAGSGYTCDKSTAGALPYTNGAVRNWLARLAASATFSGTLYLVDRLWSCSGMGFAASTYTVTTPGSLPARITDAGLGCDLWVENFAAAGAASGTLTANYKDSAAASKSGVIAAVQSAPVIGQMQLVPLANNLGVSQLTSVVTSATWTSGSFGMTVAKRIAEIPLSLANTGLALDWAGVGLPALTDDMCLSWIWLPNAASAPTIIGSYNVIDK